MMHDHKAYELKFMCCFALCIQSRFNYNIGLSSGPFDDVVWFGESGLGVLLFGFREHILCLLFAQKCLSVSVVFLLS